MPHADEDEAKTTLFVPASRAAGTTLRVPVTLTALLVSGSWMERGSEGRAARSWETRYPRSGLRPVRSSRLAAVVAGRRALWKTPTTTSASPSTT